MHCFHVVYEISILSVCLYYIWQCVFNQVDLFPQAFWLSSLLFRRRSDWHKKITFTQREGTYLTWRYSYLTLLQTDTSNTVYLSSYQSPRKFKILHLSVWHRRCLPSVEKWFRWLSWQVYTIRGLTCLVCSTPNVLGGRILCIQYFNTQIGAIECNK